MKMLEELYPSIFKMIRGKAKITAKVRFEKNVHINIAKKIGKDLHRLFSKCQAKTKICTEMFPSFQEKNREKIFKKDKRGKNHTDILHMIMEDRAIIPLNKIKRLSKWFCNYYTMNASVCSKIYPIVQTFIENKIYDYTLRLLEISKKKKKKTVRSIYVYEI